MIVFDKRGPAIAVLAALFCLTPPERAFAFEMLNPQWMELRGRIDEELKNKQFQKAEKLAREQLKFVPPNAPNDMQGWWAHYNLAQALAGQGKTREALQEIEKAELRYDETMNYFKNVHSNNTFAPLRETAFYKALQARFFRPDPWLEMEKQALKLYENKNAANMEKLIAVSKEQLQWVPQERTVTGYRTYHNLACGYAFLGKKDEALQYLKKAFQTTLYASYVDWAQKDGDLASIRNEPGYLALIKEYESLKTTDFSIKETDLIAFEKQKEEEKAAQAARLASQAKEEERKRAEAAETEAALKWKDAQKLAKRNLKMGYDSAQQILKQYPKSEAGKEAAEWIASIRRNPVTQDELKKLEEAEIAQRSLGLAKNFMNNNMRDRAKEELTVILKKYEQTPAATEAKELLDKL